MHLSVSNVIQNLITLFVMITSSNFVVEEETLIPEDIHTQKAISVL